MDDDSVANRFEFPCVPHPDVKVIRDRHGYLCHTRAEIDYSPERPTIARLNERLDLVADGKFQSEHGTELRQRGRESLSDVLAGEFKRWLSDRWLLLAAE